MMEMPDRGSSRRSIKVLEGTFIPHGQQRDVFERIDRLRDRCSVHGAPDDDAESLGSRLLLISGESGAGKSRLLKEYRAREKRRPGAFRSDDDGDVRPVIYVENAAKGTREFGVLILKAMGYPAPPRDWTAADVSMHIAHLCREMRTEVLLVDEAQFIVMGKGADGIQAMRDFVKRLLNHCPAQLVLAGVPDLLAFLEPDGESTSDHRQIFRRRAPVLELVPYDWSLPKEQARFRNLLTEMQRLTGLEFLQPLDGEFLARRLYLASEGEIGIVAKYLAELVSSPPRKGASPVSPDDLAEIWWSFHRPLGRRDRPLSFDEVRGAEDKADQSANPFLANDDQLRVLWRQWALGSRVEPAQGSDKADSGSGDRGMDERPHGSRGRASGRGATKIRNETRRGRSQKEATRFRPSDF